MYSEIVKLEGVFNSLLPDRKLIESPKKELLKAARAWSEEVWKASELSGKLPLNSEEIKKGQTLTKHPVFVCGAHRSGTTLVRDLLDAHPALTVLPSEGSFRTHLGPVLDQMLYENREAFLGQEWLRRLANPINQPPYWLLGHSTPESSPYVEFARALSSWYAIAEKENKSKISMWPHLAVILAYATCFKESWNGLNARYWVDKTPTNERYLNQIWREFPDARIIHIVRNPVDVLLSHKRAAPSMNIRVCLKNLESSYKIALRQSHLNKSRYLVLRYEDLCEKPQASISQITNFLQIEELPSLFIPTVNGKLAKANSSFNSSLPEGRIIKTPRHSFNEGLSVVEEEYLSAYLSESAPRLGYQLHKIGGVHAGLIRLKFEIGHFSRYFNRCQAILN